MFRLIELRKPYLLFLGETTDRLSAKTAGGVAHWRPEHCLAQTRLPGGTVDLGLPEMSIAEAASAGAGALVLGLAPVGGGLPASWVAKCVEALEAGLDIASGLHARLVDIPEIAAAAGRTGRAIHDVRTPPAGIPCGTGRKRSGKRMLTVGSDCCVGKMYSALALDAELRTRGAESSFRATGQTGILIEGAGVAVDAVVADFLSGAVEQLSPAAAPEHWDVIEGQGSLFHPAYAGVSLGLLHGAQPDALVLCHELGRDRIDGDYDDVMLPPLGRIAETNLAMARLNNPNVRLVGCSLNSSNFPEAEALERAQAIEAELGVPVVDPVRTGVGRIIDHLLEG